MGGRAPPGAGRLNPSPDLRLERARRRARLVLGSEAVALALAPSAALLALWATLALAGEPVWLPVPLVALVTLGLFASAAFIAARRLAGFRRPSLNAVDRRLERASALPHRPLGALRDRPAADGGGLAAAAATLWSAHQDRAASGLGRLRTGWPLPPLAAVDRWRLRFALPLLLVIGFAVAGGQSGDDLLASLLPGVADTPGPAGRIEAWITPPAFSGMAPVFLRTGGEDPAPVPAGSRLSVALTGSDSTPRLVLDDAADRKPRFHRLAHASWQAGAVLDRSTELRVRQGGHLVAAWFVGVDPVGAPRVSWTAPPGIWRGGWRTRLPWSVRDRFGVVALRAELRPVRPPGTPPIRVSIPLNGTPSAASGTELPDLVSSPFAGTAVDATLFATNGARITGRSPVVRFTLPARPFHDPLARAVLAVRRRLALDPGSRDAAVADLRTLGEVPGAFDGRLGIFLNLEGAASLLQLDRDRSAIDDADDRLWQLALQIEDEKRSGAAAAESDLAVRAARDAVDRQVARMRELGPAGRSADEQAELSRRLDALRRALAGRMAALTKEALRQGLVLPPGASRAVLGPRSFDRMMQAVQQDAASGRVDDAARALSRMEDLLDRMRPATADDVRRALAARAASEAASSDMAAMSDMVKRESALLDRAGRRLAPSAGPANGPAEAPPPPTFRTGPNGELRLVPPGLPDGATPPGAAVGAPGGAPGGADGSKPGADVAAAARSGDRAVQKALQRAASVLSRQFGALSGQKQGGLDQAGSAMGRAVAALSDGEDRAAAAAEAEAVRDLQQGGRDMQQAMRSGGAGGSPESGAGALVPGFGPGGPGDGGDEADGDATGAGGDDQTARDPLGRSLDGQGKGTADDTELALPGSDANAKSRRIEEELRRRDSDRQRPRKELDYLGRLLQPF